MTFRDYNCGRFLIKFADMLISGENPADWDGSGLMDYMKEWSINLVCHGKDKLKKGYDTPPDTAGSDYHEHNNMVCDYEMKKRARSVKKEKI